MEYKVCILSAGKNSQVECANDFNISLLPIGERSALTTIIDKFPNNVEIVIAVGYNSHLIKDFIDLAYNNRKIRIVEVDHWDKPGGGPGKTLLDCKPYLNCPFIFTSADTIVSEDVPEPRENWIGVSQVSDSTNYCMADVENEQVINFFDKIDTSTLLRVSRNFKTILNNAFIGMAGIKDYEFFWRSLEMDQNLIRKELQVSNGLSGLIPLKIKAIHFFNWFDIGNEAGYSFATRFFEKNKVVLKPEEFIYFENGRVIKYFKNKEIVKKRVERAKSLKNIVPQLIDVKNNFYVYDFIEGTTLSKVNDSTIFKELLEFCKDKIWIKRNLSQNEHLRFKDECKIFYYDKTLERLKKFYSQNKIKDKGEIINGEKIPKLYDMLKIINWSKMFEGIPVNFHGDLQPENILVSSNGFQLLDWRQDFAGNLDYGDIYYDFAKLHHALIVTHEVIRNNQYEITNEKGNIKFDFFLKNNLFEYKELFESFLQREGYDLGKLKILTPLIFLNISPLHHYPYNEFLYYLGKYTLFRELETNTCYKLKEVEVERLY